MKKILSMITTGMMAIVMLFGMAGCMMEKPLPEYESEYFKYAVRTKNDGTQVAYLTGFTELGQQQTELILPEDIDGIPISCFGYRIGGPFGDNYKQIGEFISENLRKIYVPFSGENWGWYWGEVSNLPNARFVIWEDWKIGNSLSSLPNNHGCIVGYNLLREETLKIISYKSQESSVVNNIANVTYLYNYENSDNADNGGYYWVDSYDNDIISFIPPAPIREGYRFKGWYKEAECINKWDFTTDKTGDEIWRNYSNLEDYKSGITYLYAKWEKE